MRSRFYLFWAGHFELLLSPPGRKTLVIFFPADFLDPLKPPEEPREMCGSGGIGFLQEKGAGKIVTRVSLPIDFGLYTKFRSKLKFSFINETLSHI